MRELRIVWRSRWPGVPTARAVSDAVEHAAQALSDAGAQVVEGDPGFTRDELMAVWSDYFPIVSAAMMECAGMALPVKAAGADTGLVGWIKVQERRDPIGARDRPHAHAALRRVFYARPPSLAPSPTLRRARRSRSMATWWTPASSTTICSRSTCSATPVWSCRGADR
jgi:Asp-tRNA(Asn)/Glu-tRNA(Gln) amidotransferase A subunit family amidase